MDGEDFSGRLMHQASLWDNAELLEDLLQIDHSIDCVDSWGRSALHAASVTNNSRCLQILINAGANINLQCGPRGDFKTPLHFAAEHGHESNCQRLLNAGCSFVMKDSFGLTALDLADRNRHEGCVNILKSVADSREELRSMKYDQIKVLVQDNDITGVKLLLESLADDSDLIVNMTSSSQPKTLLYYASEMNYIEIVHLLVEAGADGSGSDGRSDEASKYSPLYISCFNNYVDLSKYLLDKFPEMAQLLHFYTAIINGHIDIVDLLLNFSYPEHVHKTFNDPSGQYEYRFVFNPNSLDASGQTALYTACLLGNCKLVEKMLDWKVLFFKKNTGDDIKVASQLSPTSGKISSGILSIMTKLSSRQDNIDCSYQLLKNPLDINILCGATKENSVLAAIRGGFIDVVHVLLSHGADPNIIARNPILDQNDLSIDATFEFSNTPLAEATRQKSLAMVDLLIKHNAKDEDSTALNIAIQNSDEHIMCRILSIKSYPDPDFKINKKGVSLGTELRPSSSNHTYSSLFPNTATMINWHNSNGSLPLVHMSWLSEATLSCNPKLRGHPQAHSLCLAAITRIDLSHNQLKTIPIELLTLASIRILNVAQNKIVTLPTPKDSGEYYAPVLEELYLQDNRLDQIPENIFRLPNLQTVDVSNNKLQILPYELWQSPRLRELNVAFNLLKDLPSLPKEPCIIHSESLSPVSDAFLFNNQYAYDESNEIQSRKNITKVENIVQHSIWSRSLEVTDEEVRVSDLKNDLSITQLSSLNLANNLFTSIPLALPCLAVNLTRLNMSYNSLRSMGHVTSYPSSLKQLDLSHNEITCWPSLPRISVSDPHIACYNQNDNRKTKNSSVSSLSSNTTQITSSKSEVQVVKSSQSSNNITLRSAVLKSVCSHRRHLRMDSLRTLVLSDNLLTKIQLTTDDSDIAVAESDRDTDWNIVTKSKLIFPNLTLLNLSNNILKKIPESIKDLSNLSVLNISGNVDISELPPQMGLLSRIWTLNTTGCSLKDPLKSMINSKKYKTSAIISFLRSKYDQSQVYNRMKLMVVGVQGIGKTSLLEQLRNENGSSRGVSNNHWTTRMGHSSNSKPSRGNISTVGVDISTWYCDKKRSNSNYGPVVFRTWDFGGQKEYYATHQYFLSKRSLYLVLWRIVDGRKGLVEVLKWLANIQGRAPNAPVLIVGTHFDGVGNVISVKKAEELQQIIRERFIAVVDAEKLGLPRVLDSIEVSCKTGHNIKLLSNMIYDTAFSLRLPGSKECLLQQQVPATYLALEDIVGQIALQMKASGVEPVLKFEAYRDMVNSEMLSRNYKCFRDNSELNQATMFLHENGVLLHYDDATLDDLYFVDPQWLCDFLSSIVTVREINPFANNGIMKMEDLQHLFKNLSLASNDNRSYFVSLLNKFEIALSWDSRSLLIPSLLPTESEMVDGNVVCVNISSRTRGFGMISKQYKFPLKDHASKTEPISSNTMDLTNSNSPITRLLLMSYFPSGFWSRLITRILADEKMVDAVRKLYPLTRQLQSNITIYESFIASARWSVWQTGLALYFGNNLVFHVKEISDNCFTSPFRNSDNRFQIQQEGVWSDIDLIKPSILELYVPFNSVGLNQDSGNDQTELVIIDPDKQFMTQLLAISVDHIDLLLEDFYPAIGTRFLHTQFGRFLVTRLVCCPQCLKEHAAQNICEKTLTKSVFKRMTSTSDKTAGGLNEISKILVEMKTGQDTSTDGDYFKTKSLHTYYTWMIEECILAAYNKSSVQCPAHGDIDLNVITPDVKFLDLPKSYLIKSADIGKGTLLGRGAFGFVFKSTVRRVGQASILCAMKMLQPVNPGPRANYSAIMAYKAALGKWDRDPMQHACKVYISARQELAVLLTLCHQNIVPLIGVCTNQPLALVLELAPKGSLDGVLKQFRKNGARIGPFCFQATCQQTSRALEYLHSRNIIYRDLKSENILVYDFPEPRVEDHPLNKVYVKIADYGISRIAQPSGSKGFGGTEGFMAPEIMRHNGEEEYNEKVDCFSFGMFLFELITLRLPFEGYDAVKESILEGNRPILSKREILNYPTYALDLMVLCWAQQPKDRPTASSIVSISSATEFTHLLDILSLSHNGNTISGIGYPISKGDDPVCGFELWLPCSNSRIDLLLCSTDVFKGWKQYHRISCPQLYRTASHHMEKQSSVRNDAQMKLTAVCIVESSIWIGDSNSNIHAFNASYCLHLFSYSLEVGDSSEVIELVFLDKVKRVAAGLANGRIFLLDSCLIPKTTASAEGSFVLTELGSNGKLYSLCAVFRSIDNDLNTYELWCGGESGIINVYSFNESGVCNHDSLAHFEKTLPCDDLKVTKLLGNEDMVYSYVSPSSKLYAWDSRHKKIITKLDCSKLIPCSESLKSIAIEEHLSPTKCQITSLAVLKDILYIGTTWGCLIIVEAVSLMPITVFRPFNEDLLCIIPLPVTSNMTSQYIVTVGRGYRSLIERFTEVKNLKSSDKDDNEVLYLNRSENMHALLWRADNWSI